MRHWIAPILCLCLASATLGEDAQLSKTVETFCASCHAGESPEAKLNLSAVVGQPVESHPEIWEKVVRRLRSRQMPPVGEDRPPEAAYVATLSQLESTLDRQAKAHP